MTEIKIIPIGEVKTKIDRNILKALGNKKHISKLIIFDEYIECLDRIEDFSHIIICYWAHLVSIKQRDIKKVHPKGNPKFPEVGIFSTHSQVRPNPICITISKLLKREDNVLFVKNLDAFNESPILDIKPYISFMDKTMDLRMPEWINKIKKK
jgi:tRNA-Thr(GGU) m(6)t(6)A37 methyltransferase TsaA